MTVLFLLAGIFLMLLQGVAELVRDVLRLRGHGIPPRGYVPDRAVPGEETQ